MKRLLSVAEGKWDEKSHVSIRDILAPLFDVWGEGGADFHYEMFSTNEAFRTALEFAFRPQQADCVYVASHGLKDAIEAYHEDERVSRTEIVNSIKAAVGTASRGLYFGACLFTSQKNASLLLHECPRVSWVAGYSNDVDWIDSSVLDLFFLRHLLFATPGKGHKAPKTSAERVRYAAKKTNTSVSGLARELGFHVFVRKPYKSGEIEDLIQHST